MIGELRDRGLTLQTIRELVADDHPARTVSEWLGVDATLAAPWSDDRPADRLPRRAGGAGRQAAGRAARAHRRVAGRRLRRRCSATAAGWCPVRPCSITRSVWAGPASTSSCPGGCATCCAVACRGPSTTPSSCSPNGQEPGSPAPPPPDELATALGALRPIAREMSSVILAQEVERALPSWCSPARDHGTARAIGDIAGRLGPSDACSGWSPPGSPRCARHPAARTCPAPSIQVSRCGCARSSRVPTLMERDRSVSPSGGGGTPRLVRGLEVGRAPPL